MKSGYQIRQGVQAHTCHHIGGHACVYDCI